MTRYAIYIAPEPDSALWRFGSAVLGYDAQTGEEAPQPELSSLPPHRFHEHTHDPRRYGFHATIKSPMRLAEGRSESELIAALREFCAARAAFTLPRLAVEAVGANGRGDAFIALVEPSPSAALLALERDVVLGFEPFRAPLTEEEIARRHPERLDARQRDYLFRYGYPGVLEEFRFHLTLTGRIPAGELQPVLAELRELFARDVPEATLPVRELAVYRQFPRERFTIIARCPMREIADPDE